MNLVLVSDKIIDYDTLGQKTNQQGLHNPSHRLGYYANEIDRLTYLHHKNNNATGANIDRKPIKNLTAE